MEDGAVGTTSEQATGRSVQALVEELDLAIGALAASMTSSGGSARLEDVRASWSALVAGLDLPPLPDRECPTCRGLGMSGATTCGHCWAKLDPGR
jgi:hypothetical protein